MNWELFTGLPSQVRVPSNSAAGMRRVVDSPSAFRPVTAHPESSTVAAMIASGTFGRCRVFLMVVQGSPSLSHSFMCVMCDLSKGRPHLHPGISATGISALLHRLESEKLLRLSIDYRIVDHDIPVAGDRLQNIPAREFLRCLNLIGRVGGGLPRESERGR